MDNIATNYFQTWKKLTLKQARWQEFFMEFDLSLVDTLSKKTNDATAQVKRCGEEMQQEMPLKLKWTVRHL